MKFITEIEQDALLSDDELYLFHEGTLYESFRTFGAHFVTHQGAAGVRFAVWAPHATNVSVIGNFNGWNGDVSRMTRIKSSGVWVLFIPGLNEGELYKYEIHTSEGETLHKADPYAFYSERRPKTASVVRRLDHYEWQDQKWLAERRKNDHAHKPMFIYEMHAGTWKKKHDGTHFSYRELAEELIPHVLSCGYTHIELMPVMEHPYDRSWGYQVTGFYSITSRYGTAEDFMFFVEACHKKGIGVILDWVPVHFCKDAHGLGRFDGTPLYEPVDPLKSERPNWGTYNFDFSKPEVVSFLVSNIRFWMDVYHIDGFRVDAVSSMIYLNHDHSMPVILKNEHGGEENLEAIDFIKKLNNMVAAQDSGVLMIAEEATPWPQVTDPAKEGGLGFHYKWNMGWSNDVLKYMELDYHERPHHHNLLTFSFLYAFSEDFILPFSHDELVYGKRSLLNKMPGDYWKKFANLRLLMGYLISHPGKKLLFMGSEFAQFDEWKDETELDWFLFDYESHQRFFHYFKAMAHFYNETSCLWRLDREAECFEWIDPNDSHQSVITFIRRGKRLGDYAVVVCNFSPEVYHSYRIGVPSLGKYVEVFNSDAESFGGSGQCNQEALVVDKEPYHNQRYSMDITVPPLGVVIFMKQTKTRRGKQNGS